MARPLRSLSGSITAAPTHRDGTVNLSAFRLGGAGTARYLSSMTTLRDPLYAGYRYPAELISYAVWLYFRFPLT